MATEPIPNTSLFLADFSFELPPELIAQAPAAARTSSRLLHVAGTRLDDLSFADLPAHIAPGDLVVFNDTRVIRARLVGAKPTGGRVEALIEEIVGDDRAWAQLRASHLPKPGGTVAFGGATATVLDRKGRLFLLEFDAPAPLADWLERHGSVPLPPYIARPAAPEDADRYQTVYARYPGAVAAPTAGLHFDPPLISAIAGRGVEMAYVTLHVGAGTFQPIEVDDLSQHRMHTERYEIPATTAAAVEAARARGGRVLAVGTTTLRALESAVDADGRIRPGPALTDLFITPGFDFRVVDRLLTNFHLPRSTLLLLVSAFGGADAIRRAYAHAIAQKYRFFSYGDAMLLEPAAR